LGMCLWSPLLDRMGNSARSLKVSFNQVQRFDYTHFQCICGLRGIVRVINSLNNNNNNNNLTAVGLFSLLIQRSETLPDFIQNPMTSSDCFRRSLKT